jgi:heme/copper-type cytochrome/quinol oxidase subunit 2
MRTFRSLAFIPAAALLFAACGDDSAENSTSADTSVNTVVADVTTTAAPDTPVVTEAPVTTVEVTVPETAVDGPVQIDVVVGLDSGPERVVQVKVGSDVTLNITNPDAADEFHVHGIDLEQAADAGVMITMNFTIDAAGIYEVESHVTDGVLVVIEAT